METTRYVVLCKDGRNTDGVVYVEQKSAEATREAADKQAFCKDCSPHRIVTLVEECKHHYASPGDPEEGCTHCGQPQWLQACMSCRSEPNLPGPCDCSHAPCIHDKNRQLVELETQVLERVAAAIRWPLSERDQTHAVDNYRKGRWDAYEIIQGILKSAGGKDVAGGT